MDIRSFFGGAGGGKAKSSTKSASSTSREKKQKRKEVEVEEVEEKLEDSDFEEEEVVKKRRRLKTMKEVEEGKKQKIAASVAVPAPDSCRLVEKEIVDLEERAQEPRVVEVVEKKETPVKKAGVVKRKKESPAKTLKRTEIKGGAAAFFGTVIEAEDIKTSESDDHGKTAIRTSSQLQSESTPDCSLGTRTHNALSHQTEEDSTSSSSPRREGKRARLHEKEVLIASAASAISLEKIKEFLAETHERYPSCGLKQRMEDIIRSGPDDKSSQCLGNLRVAFTGIMERFISRDCLQDLYLSHGAKVLANVSGNTHFLLAADESLDDGRPVKSGRKYQRAIEIGVPILEEKKAVSLLLYAIDSSTNAEGIDVKPEPLNVPLMSSGRAKAINSAYKEGAKVNDKINNSQVTKSSSSARISPPKDASELLWVDKYKPARLEDVVGGTENIKKIVDWLKRWDAVHIKKTQKVAYTKENPGAKAVLISGPPGIGKTTLATLVAKTMGYEVLELNASDSRNKSTIEDQVKDVVMSRALSSSGGVRQRLVIMDEVDGMGGSDRGGIAELIKVIKVAKNPIICICNDRQAMKIKSLAGHCFDIRLRRPTKSTVAQRLVQIGRQEGLMIEINAAELLVEQMGNDIRQCINAAQMWKAQSNVMRYSDLRAPPPCAYQASAGGSSTSTADSGRLKSIEKDKILRQSPFDACGLILGGSKHDFNERYNSFFIDYSLIPLLVQQNYIESSQNGLLRQQGGIDADKLDLMSKAADSVSEMELLGAQVRGNDQHWELLPAQAALSLRVGSIIQGYQNFPSFPQWLGKNSTTSKSKRLTQELVVHTLQRVGQGFESIRLEYNCYLKFILTKILKVYGSGDMPPKEDGSVVSGVREVIDVLDSYGLSKDDLMETMQALQFVVTKDPQLQDSFAFMDSKLKAALTREYNSSCHSSQGLVESLDVKKKRRRGAVEDENEDDATTEDLGAAKEVNDDDDDSDAEVEAFLKKHSKKGKKGKDATKKKTSAKKK